MPKTLRAGTTFSVPITSPAHHPDDWGLSLHLRGPQSIDLSASKDGAQHIISAAATETAAWAAGDYWFVIRATDGDIVDEIDEGQISITPNLAAATGEFDGRTHAERVLAALEAVIEGRASVDQASYKINNRELSRTPIPDLISLRNYYREQLRRERRAARGNSLLGRNVKVRF